MKRIIALVIIVSLLVFSLVSCVPTQRASHSVTYYEFFNTVCTIYAYNSDTKAEFESVADLCYSYLSKYHKLFDIYHEYSGVVNLMTLNKTAKNGPVKVSPELFDFLVYCKQIYTLTNGENNIAMGAVLKLWHDARTADEKYLPDRTALDEASEHISIESLVLDEDNLTVYYTDPYLQLDVGAIAKGYVAELIKGELLGMGKSGYVLDIGRNYCIVGSREGGYPVGIRITNPDKTSGQKYIVRVEIADTSLVTSGDYERVFTYQGENYHHIIDKDTLMPSTHFSSVSVITDDSALADALSTALFCMSYEEGCALIESIGDVEVIWVTPDGEILKSRGFDKYIA